MTDILLDTDILIDLLRGYAPARVYFKQIEAGVIRRRHQSPFADAAIAATAIQQNLPLGTKNLKHFQPITGLIIQQPYS